MTPAADGEPAARERSGLGVPLLLVLALLSATAPLSIDFYLASFPQVRSSLHTDATSVQLTLTGFLIGLGVGQVGWGPVSDRFGRLRPLLVGSVVSAVAAAAAALAPSIEALIAARFVQALAGAAGVVIARAVIADLLQSYAAARAMSLMMTINGLAPVVAPIVGGALAGHVSWRGILGIIFAVTLLQVVGILLVIRETLPGTRRTPSVQLGHLGLLLRRPAFLGHAATQAFGFGTLMAYISSSSFVYQTVIGAAGWLYGLGFAVNALGLIGAGMVSARLAQRRVHPAATITRALPGLLTAAVAFLIVALSGLPSWLLVVPLLFMTTSVGFLMGNSGALALEHSRDAAGAGSAVVGGLTFLVGGAVSPLGGVAGEDTAVPAGVVMVVCAVGAILCFTAVRRYVRGRPELEKAFAVPDVAVGAE